jgi:uncharacterized protein YjbI with pentapeptide repeats
VTRCKYHYLATQSPCPHPAGAESPYCIWHNAAVRKSDPYVRDLLLQADTLAKGNLVEFHLAGLVWPKAPLSLRNLRRADLRDAFLDGADLAGADLTGANLGRTSLKHADLRGARLAEADLRSANLSGADLREAILTDAFLADTSLLGADLRGADLTGARINNFRWNRLTRFAGIRGLDLESACGASDDTRAYLAPLIRPDQGPVDLETEPSALDDLDPEQAQTHVFMVVAPVSMPVPPPATEIPAAIPTPLPIPRPHPGWMVAAVAAMVLAMVGWGVGVLGLMTAAKRKPPTAPITAPTTAALSAQERGTLQHQHETDLAEIRRLQGRERQLNDNLGTAKQETETFRAEAGKLKLALAEKPPTAPAPAPAPATTVLSAKERSDLQRQHEADLADLRRLQERERQLNDNLGTAKQEAEQLRAEAGKLKLALAEKPPTAPAPAPASAVLSAQERSNLQRQHEADLVEIRRLQERERQLNEVLGAAKQEATQLRAEAGKLQLALGESATSEDRMLTAEDRASLLAQRVEELQRLNAELARQSSRQEQLGRLLADGTARLREENLALVRQRDERDANLERAAALQTEADHLHTELATVTHERDGLQGENQKLLGDLAATQRDLERYLARLSATRLQDYLTEDRRAAPLLTLVPGRPVALGGSYLLTLRVDRGAQPATVQAQVVVQRPPGAVNPEVTVVLYDDEEHPLRRLSYSFPHVDAGVPLVSSSTTVACDRFPRFARVLVTPGLDGLSAQK